jgi:hypothetical protein
MTGSHGGKRPGAGRKPDPERQKLAQLARDHAPAALQALAEIAADRSAPPLYSNQRRQCNAHQRLWAAPSVEPAKAMQFCRVGTDHPADTDLTQLQPINAGPSLKWK